ncbi:DUF1851 domain-containing protein [Stenotrophomonas maltophilia]|uniref:T6SS immunity protein Tdi1 domain-containing protein n=1 Tax=Stenotrophomonas maltophilia TaxID=40324 RepID=UPI002ACC7CBD|nr:T6SS immunity protein Tdi1 domain-containing protein [Stenotrophomonas maltophilia]MDZ5843835.1 DUF1851 domain-containing protein [Stenotrophomonas maltophilia]
MQQSNLLDSHRLSNADAEALESLMPAGIRNQLIKRGRSVFRNGRIQLCHPQDLAMVMELALRQVPDLAPSDTLAYAYSAFGTIYFVHTKYGPGQIDLLRGSILCRRLTDNKLSPACISGTATSVFRLPDEKLDLVGHDGLPLFEAAVLKHGPLGVGQCFGFFPALGLGGAAQRDSLQVVDAAVHFSMLAQLVEFRLFQELWNGELIAITRVPPAPTLEKIVARLSPECPFQVVRYEDVKDEVPEDSLYREEGYATENSSTLVLLAPGNLRLDTLDLDNPLAPWQEEEEALSEHIRFILVRGNLEIARHIHSLETDGACGLVVSGDLTTSNAVVGGQEIRVGGSLRVKELYWGDYNHGYLHVVGSAEVSLLIQTDYSVEIEGSIQCLRRIDDVDAMDGDELAQLIDPDCLFREDPHPDSSWSLDAAAIVERWAAGGSVIRKEGLSAADPLLCTLSLFSDASISPENFLRICGEDMVPKDTCSYQFNRGGISLWVHVDIAHPEAPVYIVQMEAMSEGTGARLVMERAETSVGLIDRLLGRQPEKGWGLWKYICNDTAQDEAEWTQVEAEEIHPPFVELILTGWRFLQEGVSSRHWATQIISPTDICTLLGLEICQPYDDYEDEDRCGLWVGHCHAAFRQQTSGPIPEEPLLRLSRELRQPDGTSTIESYYYDVEICMDGEKRVRIRHKDDQDRDEPAVQIDPVGGPELADALRLFKIGAREMRRANADLLDGEAPFFAQDDAFAMRYWRERGYLSR